MRRAGKFERVSYTQSPPLHTDDDETLDRKWRDWVEEESYKRFVQRLLKRLSLTPRHTRLVFRLFEHDIQSSLVKWRAPLVSYAELSLPLPSSLDLWLAPTATAWRTTYRKKSDEGRQKIPSLKDLLRNPELLRCIPDHSDCRAAVSAYLHSLGGQVWDYRQQASLSSVSSFNSIPSAQLWLQTRQQNL